MMSTNGKRRYQQWSHPRWNEMKTGEQERTVFCYFCRLVRTFSLLFASNSDNIAGIPRILNKFKVIDSSTLISRKAMQNYDRLYSSSWQIIALSTLSSWN